MAAGVDDYTAGDTWTKQDLARLTAARLMAQATPGASGTPCQAYQSSETGKLRIILKICTNGTDTSGTPLGRLPAARAITAWLPTKVTQMPISKLINGLTKSAKPEAAAAPRVPASRTTGIAPEHGHVLAQIPDLDQKPSPLASFKRLDGRLISQAVSLKLVFGLGIGLIIGAILPFLFGRGGSPKPVHELSDWTNVRNVEATNSSGANSQAPLFQPAAQAAAIPPQPASPDISIPPPPADNYRPAVLNRRNWSPPQDNAAPQAGNLNPDYAGGNLPPPRAADRGYGPAPDRYDIQADRRNDPAARFGNPPPGHDYRGNPPNGPAMRRDVQPPAPAGEDRYNFPANRGYQQQPAAPGVPQGYNGAGYDNRNQAMPDSESGVARFNGNITAPPARTNP